MQKFVTKQNIKSVKDATFKIAKRPKTGYAQENLKIYFLGLTLYFAFYFLVFGPILLTKPFESCKLSEMNFLMKPFLFQIIFLDQPENII